MVTKFGNSLYLNDVISRSKFGIDWYGSFGSGEVHNLPLPIGTISGPYHCSAAVLASDEQHLQATLDVGIHIVTVCSQCCS